MFDRESIEVFLNKVPDLRNGWRAALTVLYILILAAACGAFFYFVDGLGPYGPFISQAAMALVVTAISVVHFALARTYREKYGTMAYRHFFYHLMIPYLVTWYACFFHPLFVAGPRLLPTGLALSLGLLFLALFLLTDLQIERAGFHTVTHGMDVYTIFPEEATVVRGEIYGYVRHPLYLSLMCGTIALAFFRNNGMAILVSLLLLIPSLAAGYMEDRELIERSGEAHSEYIRNTPALVPVKRLPGFLKLLVSFEK
ncbi:MAG: methyltransferase family protein [Anaerolineae bacterium]